ncbi:hypothetical protein [Pedobacter montanisoli]|uniref:Uncharacterized protein n=1 Tax=Pedobacter montanisoli TaxID=2923277 RepID=A0ABS9ZZG3_9SPHI|nr:hypothetical protein [Pedobacter montanisoli]MCJ0743711.1 hypothetical protein [Pedobacter montanisoli]
MDEQKKDPHYEPGSVQRQTQRNEQYDSEQTNADEQKEFGIIPESQVKGSDADKDREEEDIEDDDNNNIGPDLEEIDDEKVIPSLPRERKSWNFINFGLDDLFGGLLPA